MGGKRECFSRVGPVQITFGRGLVGLGGAIAMSAIEALRMAHVAGVALSVDQDDLVLDAPSEPPAVVLDLLRQHKAGVVELLRRGLRVRYCRWSAEEWRAFSMSALGLRSSMASCRAPKPR